jgi:hypothetical protein
MKLLRCFPIGAVAASGVRTVVAGKNLLAELDAFWCNRDKEKTPPLLDPIPKQWGGSTMWLRYSHHPLV